MKILYILISLGLLNGCVSKYPLKVNIDDYKKGLVLTNSIVKTRNIFNNKVCIVLDSSIPLTQELEDYNNKDVLYTFENKQLIEKYQNNDCNPENIIKITNIESKYSWDGMMRLNLYKTLISLESTYKCDNKIIKLKAIKEKKLKKHGKIFELGIINEKNTKALIAATIVLAFDEAISDIYNQIKSECMKGVK